jgi:hypothetical protein
MVPNLMQELIEPRGSIADSEFDDFKNKHNKTYDDEHEHHHRKNIFIENQRLG